MNAAGGVPEAAGDRRVWLRVGTLLDGSGAAPLRNAHLVYDSREIVYVGAEPPAVELLAGQVAPDSDLPEHTALPGLIESHAHLFLEGGELDQERRAAYLRQSPEQLLHHAQTRLERLVRLGIVGIRDAGDKHGVGLALSRLCRSEQRPLMPFVDSPGAAIHHRGRYGGFMAEALEDCESPQACVEARVRTGADRIKLIATGIIDFKKGAVTSPPQMMAEEIDELTASARELGRQTLAHASGAEGIENAIEGGVDSVEHGFFVTAEQLAKMRDRQTAWAPTFAPVQQQVIHAGRMGWPEQTVDQLKRILSGHAASLVRAHALGVPIVAGSDAGSYGVRHGLGLLEEMESMERAGLPSAAVVQAATGTPSRRLAFREKFGEIRPGCLSRFQLTRHSPLETVANLRRQKIVVFDGAALDEGESADTRGL